MSKRAQRGEYTRPQHQPPLPSLILPPAKAERLGQVFLVYMLIAGWAWLCEVEDVDDLPMLSAAIGWLHNISWPQTEDELWAGPPLLERRLH